ncbi:hypothetical protein J437_LFUL014995 [Ladona fulva]|uniref:Uncharacterized protein n=1 Tax=Ladona fulva TaxID=123851 RepID=A0A8K0P9E8_LADFU|nr:hypothetical protein J437_LFUL014995 [Ladona fulva]
MENKFKTSPEFYRAYRDFMEKYPISDPNVEVDKYFCLPHHGVLKESSTTKLRVVSNRSFKTNARLSLNDCFHTGPNLLSDIGL